MKDARGEIIYVGKASSLRKRVRSYFQAKHPLDLKTRRLVSKITDFEYIVTPSERDALILEDTLIKRHQPQFNVRLRDDKRYPYLKLTAEKFPRLVIARRIERDAERGARYFGPYTDAYALRQAMKALQQLFRVRTCTLAIGDKPVRQRPCLDHYLGLCDAPCVSWIDERSYQALVDEAALFLGGRHEELLPKLQKEMEAASRKLKFERAAKIRDRIQALQRLLGAKKALDGAERDAIGLYQENDSCVVQIFFVRGGKLVGRESFSMETAGSADPREILTAFVKQYYGKAAFIPREILLPNEIDEHTLIEQWLSERRGSRVRLGVPKRGSKAKLIRMVLRNAELALREEQARPLKHPNEAALVELKKLFDLEGPPRRVEGFDVSSSQGADPVASMVVFENGTPKKSDYRRFKIQSVQGPDDFAMMAEAVRRRLENALKGDERFLPFPDLILIDGGKGQLSAARGVMWDLGLAEIPTLALAKEFEHIFMGNRSEPIVLPRDSPALQLLKRVRDEAHRFALAYHRTLRGKRTVHSLLDDIAGVGPARKRALLEHFGSLKRLREAALEELLEVPGLSRRVAQQIWQALKEN